MLTAEENDTLTQVGPDKPMGRAMRRYWVPICTIAQVPAPDCDPLRVKLLGESFVVFRDTSGQVGVLDELCMHRGASLALGRVEKGGIRCLYHGWQFAADAELRALLHIPDEVEIMATITPGRPQGHHGPVRRRPLPELVYGERWGEAPAWAVDPAGATHTSAGPPTRNQ